MANARFGSGPDETSDVSFTLSLDVVTMIGAEFLLAKPVGNGEGGDWVFPSDFFHVGESPAEAARRVVREWTGTTQPKLELVDWRVSEDPWEMAFVFRALLTEEPKETTRVRAFTRVTRMELPARAGRLDGPWIEEALKTGLNYKLTRSGK